MPLVHHALHLGPLDNNTYVLVCDETGEAAIVDVGFDAEAVIAFVRKLDVHTTLLLNTHAHYDHVAGMKTVQEALGGTYWLHPEDRPLLDRLPQQGAAFGFPHAEPPAEIHDLVDGQTVMLGRQSLAVLHTPGHSPGSVTFHADRRLWCGDVLFAGSIGRTDLPGGSFDVLERAIHERLFPLGDDMRVFPGHGPETTIGDERRHNPFVGEQAGRG